MNNELKEMLQSVIHEALKPIHAELKSVKTDLTVFRDEMIDFRDETRTDLRLLKDGQKGIQVQLHDRFSETRGRFDQVDRHLRLLDQTSI